MKEDLDKINDKLDKVSEHIINIDKTLIRQEASLNEHMRRSLANEEAINILKDELKPVTIHVLQMKTVGKIVGGLGVLAALAVAIKELIS